MKQLDKGLPGIAATALLGIAVLLCLPLVAGIFTLLQVTLYVILSLFALSLAYIWGFGGIFCFGQAAFFGAGAYAFAVASINFGDTTHGLLLAPVVAGAFAAGLGYFMFYGRLNDMYMGIVTMLVTLICGQAMSQTGGAAFTIGKVRLGGFNGIPNVPALNVPGNPGAHLDILQSFRLAMIALVAAYLLIRLLQRTAFGRATVAVRENETRAALLGYDVRRQKLIVFTIGAAIAGVAGALFAAHQGFVDPNVFSMAMAAQCIIWVLLGGVGTLLGPILACFGLQYFVTWLSGVSVANNNFVLGVVLMVIVLVLPSGLLPSIRSALARFRAPASAGRG